MAHGTGQKTPKTEYPVFVSNRGPNQSIKVGQFRVAKSKAYKAVEQHACKRLRQWLCAKHKVVGMGTGRFPDVHLHNVLGLVRLTARPRSFPCAKS